MSSGQRLVVQLRLFPGETAAALQVASPDDQVRALDLLAARHLAEVLRAGRSILPDSAASVSVRLTIGNHTASRLVPAADALGWSLGTLVREIVAADAAEQDRTGLELRYRTANGPGDPTRLSTTILRYYVETPVADSGERTIVRHLLTEVAQLAADVERLRLRVDAGQPASPTRNIMTMEIPDLQAYLWELGGPATSEDNTAWLFAMIRDQLKKNARHRRPIPDRRRPPRPGTPPATAIRLVRRRERLMDNPDITPRWPVGDGE